MRNFFFRNLSVTVLFLLVVISIALPVCAGASGSWQIPTVDEGRVGNGASLARDSRGFAPVISIDFSNGNLKYAGQDGSGWHATTVDTQVVGWTKTSLALDHGGNPRISYYNTAAVAVKYIQAATPGDPQLTTTTISSIPAASPSVEPPGTAGASIPETDQASTGFILLTGLVAGIFCIFCIVTFRFSKSPEKTTYHKKDLNVLVFPDETKIFFVLVILLSFAGVLRMLLFFTDLFGEFSRTAFAYRIYVEPDLSFLILIPFIILALLVYSLRPLYLIWKERMVRLEGEAPAIAAEISGLAGSLDMATPVTAMLSPDNGVDIYTFGTHREHYIVMNRGFIDVFHDHAEEFRAILYHELAHIRSGDVKRTELALAFLTSFFCVAVVFLGMGITTITINFFRYGEDLGYTKYYHDYYTDKSGFHAVSVIPALQNFITNFSTAIIIIAIVGVSIWFLIRFIIRYRELYADWMATHLMGESVSLERALARMQAVVLYRGKRHGFFSHPRCPIVPRYHPTIKDRQEFIDDPGKFFSSGLSMPFIIGFSVAWLFQMMALFQMMGTIPPGPDNMLVSVYIPRVFLAAALLLPRLTSQLVLPHNTRFWYANPVVVSQIFMLGYASSSYIIINLSQVLDTIIHDMLLIGTPVEFNMSYVYLGMAFPPYHPAIALIGAELVAVSVLGILLTSMIVTQLLVEFTAFQWLFRHPVLSFLVLPGTLAAGIVLTALIASPVLALGLLFFMLLVLILARRKFRKCPVCASQVPGSFDPGISCPACGFDFGWWIKNAK